MRQIIILAVVIAAVSGAAIPSKNSETTQDYYEPDEVLYWRNDVDNIGLGNYKYAFELRDGTKQEQEGSITNKGREDEALEVKGSYSWQSVGELGDLITHTVVYTAGVEGYKPVLSGSASLGGGIAGHALLSALGG